MAVIIPFVFMAIAGLYVQQTWAYDDFESVKFPYAIAAALVLLSVVIAASEIRRSLKSGQGLETSVSPASLSALVTGRKLNPFYLVVLTVAFAAVLPTIKTLAALYFFVLGLRLVFRTLNLKGALLDALLVVVIYLVFHDFLLILLPAGPVEEGLSAFVRASLP